MRAQTIYKKAYVFDFDETLVRTTAKIHIYRNGAHYKSLSAKEYNFYTPKKGDKFDFSEFNDGQRILDAKKYIMWPVIHSINKAVREDKSTSDIYILTSRSSIVKSYIYEFLKRNGIDIDINNIITIGDDNGKLNISNEKRKKLINLTHKYDEILFFDDDPKNINLAKSIPGIKTRLVETLNEKFKEDSDPIEDMGIGTAYIRKLDYEKMHNSATYADVRNIILSRIKKYPIRFPENEEKAEAISRLVYFVLRDNSLKKYLKYSISNLKALTRQVKYHILSDIDEEDMKIAVSILKMYGIEK